MASPTAGGSIRNLKRTPASRMTGNARRKVSVLLREVDETCSFQPWPTTGAPGGSAMIQ